VKEHFVWIAILEGLGFLPFYDSNSKFLEEELWVIRNKIALDLCDVSLDLFGGPCMI